MNCVSVQAPPSLSGCARPWRNVKIPGAPYSQGPPSSSAFTPIRSSDFGRSGERQVGFEPHQVHCFQATRTCRSTRLSRLATPRQTFFLAAAGTRAKGAALECVGSRRDLFHRPSYDGNLTLQIFGRTLRSGDKVRFRCEQWFGNRRDKRGQRQGDHHPAAGGGLVSPDSVGGQADQSAKHRTIRRQQGLGLLDVLAAHCSSHRSTPNEDAVSESLSENVLKNAVRTNLREVGRHCQFTRVDAVIVAVGGDTDLVAPCNSLPGS